MADKEALEYIKNHGVWRFAAIHGWNTPDDKLIRSFETIEKDLDEFSEYKKLEEKVGLSLFIINKALTDGIWFKYDSLKPIIFVEPCDVYPTKGSYLRIFNTTVLEFKDYGKTWALTREELENDD